MDVRRRDVLKAVAASVVVGATSAVTSGAHRAGADDRLPTADGRETVMNSRPLMTVRITAAPPQQLGAVPHGTRSMVPVTGGDFEGPRLRGKVLPGGGDWLLLRSDGVLELDLRITLETDDQASHYFRTLPRFETSTEKYAFLNRILAVGVGEARPDGAIHQIDEIL